LRSAATEFVSGRVPWLAIVVLSIKAIDFN